MQNVTGGEASPDTISDTSALEAKVRNSIAHGNNVREEVRDFTVKALSTQDQDQKSLRKVVTAVMKGVSEGAQQKLQQAPAQTQAVLEPVRDAVAGLDAALAQLAEASKLALEEAAGRAQKFSNEELTRARTELESVETLFLDVVQASASAAQELVKETLGDLIGHAKRNGTAVGSQVKDTLVVFNQQMTSVGQNQLEAGIELTHAITNLMREATAGVLAGIAERVKPDDIPKTDRG
ncbi:DUF6781 family protein [Nitrosospira sp. Nsp1]|uniref:DUF6781 family protein n=1 Tax=Nitrosospira sp. Nsp1 TaxID=136547 RepID=UPI00087F260B|nr:DUF6781 family protein [Nitrosospira sp. Nsp1]SCX63142.1 hypothetical protein SAMN05720354_13512 [Nitrosospira sp. Nsp1]